MAGAEGSGEGGEAGAVIGARRRRQRRLRGFCQLSRGANEPERAGERPGMECGGEGAGDVKKLKPSTAAALVFQAGA